LRQLFHNCLASRLTMGAAVLIATVRATWKRPHGKQSTMDDPFTVAAPFYGSARIIRNGWDAEIGVCAQRCWRGGQGLFDRRADRMPALTSTEDPTSKSRRYESETRMEPARMIQGISSLAISRWLECCQQDVDGAFMTGPRGVRSHSLDGPELLIHCTHDLRCAIAP
jgi:hypothetical protein